MKNALKEIIKNIEFHYRYCNYTLTSLAVDSFVDLQFNDTYPMFEKIQIERNLLLKQGVVYMDYSKCFRDDENYYSLNYVFAFKPSDFLWKR